MNLLWFFPLFFSLSLLAEKSRQKFSGCSFHTQTFQFDGSDSPLKVAVLYVYACGGVWWYFDMVLACCAGVSTTPWAGASWHISAIPTWQGNLTLIFHCPAFRVCNKVAQTSSSYIYSNGFPERTQNLTRLHTFQFTRQLGKTQEPLAPHIGPSNVSIDIVRQCSQ